MSIAEAHVMVDNELTVLQARECLAWLERRAVQAYLNRGRALSEAVRDFMADNYSGSATTRVEFEEAVRHVADAKYLDTPGLV